MTDHATTSTDHPAAERPPAAAETVTPSAPDTGQPGGPAAVDPLPGRLTIPVTELAAHPGNVRENLDLNAEFCASVAEAGVRVPLLVIPADGGGYQVIEGHRRLAAAVKAGLEAVPCHIDASRAADQPGQYLDMLLANSSTYRRNLTPVEEAGALFAAHEAGASKTRLRKTTGRKAEQIKTALAAGGISAQTREAAGDLAGQLNLDQLGLLAEFDGDQQAIQQILAALRRGLTVEYTAERIRQDRAEAAGHQRIRAELEAAGTPVTGDLPEGAVRLSALTCDEEDITPEAHAGCPGRGVFFPMWDRLHPVHYCTDPGAYGHTVRSLLLRRETPGAAGPGTPDDPAGPPADTPADPGRRLVIEGNKAWRAAAEVRKRWLATVLFPRRAAPREAAPFITGQLLAMPDPLRSGLAAAPGRELFREITGQPAARLLQICESTAANRLPLLMLGPVVTAYEQALTEGDGKNTWRTDRYAPCPRREAARYLAFLASIGYRLSVIEQALADDRPYTGDTPPEPLGDLDAPATAAEPVPGGDPVTGDPAPGAEDTGREDTGGTAGQAAA